MAGNLSIKRVNAKKKTGRYGDGNGLYLQVSKWKSKAWVFRYQLHGRSHEMGLGPYPLISLAEARDAALANRRLLHERRDPIEAGIVSGRRSGWRRRRRSHSGNVPTPTSRLTKRIGRTPSIATSGGRRWTSPAKP